MTYPTLKFMNDVRKQFGEFEFRVMTDKAQITSTGWPEDPDHQANAPDSKFVVPQLAPKQVKDLG